MNIPSTTPLHPSENKELVIGIIGLGAIGCLISSQLPANATIYALPRNNLSENFSFSISNKDNSTQYKLPIWRNQPLDILILCCKANQCSEAMNQWHNAIKPSTQIVLLQNGMGQHEYIENLYPDNSIYAASTTEGAFRNSASEVIHAGQGTTLWGSYNATEAFKLPLNLLKGQHLWTPDIKQVLRDKLAINAVINPLTVKYQCQNGSLLTNPEALSALRILVLEIEGIFNKLQWDLSFNLLNRAVEICKLTANNYSSMLQDVNNGAPTEIDFINGYLLNKANEMKIEMPLSSTLIKKIKKG